MIAECLAKVIVGFMSMHTDKHTYRQTLCQGLDVWSVLKSQVFSASLEASLLNSTSLRLPVITTSYKDELNYNRQCVMVLTSSFIRYIFPPLFCIIYPSVGTGFVFWPRNRCTQIRPSEKWKAPHHRQCRKAIVDISLALGAITTNWIAVC